MLKPFFSISFILLAALSYFAGIKPMSDQVKVISLDLNKYKETLQKGNGIKEVLAQMKVTADSVTEEDKISLTTLLPDKIDIVKKALNLESLTSSSSSKKPLLLLGAVDGKEGVQTRQLAVDGASEQNYSTFTINFSALGTYESLKRFLADLSKNKVVSDVESLSFSASERSPEQQRKGPELFDFKIRIKTYWLPYGGGMATKTP